MRYVIFRDMIQKELIQNPAGLTWADLNERLDLPYGRPCPAWVERLEKEIGLSRKRSIGRAFVWKLREKNRRKKQRASVPVG
jgi:hypothetical protein